MSGARLLVIGRSGQVAQALAGLGHEGGAELTCLGRPDVDLREPETLRRAIETVRPDAILNAAAYTSVDEAESDPAAAFALNEAGPTALAEAARAAGVPLIHLSTDCVFDGQLDRPYRPGDAANPLGVYGASKLAGEEAIAGPGVVIVRVSWIFSRFGSNFVRTMLALATRLDEVRVVNDQTGCPTHAEDLARGLIEVARQTTEPRFSDWGTYHLAGAGEADRASMARAIFEGSAIRGGPVASVAGVPTSDYPTPASRPLNARLDSELARQVFGVALPHWRARLESAVEQILLEDELT